MSILSKSTWKKHANPLSGWSRLLSYPLLFVALWYHNWIALAAVAVWFIVNPVIFPEPKSIDNWMSKSVLGEQLWTEKVRTKFPHVFNVFNGVFFIVALYASYQNLFWHVFYSVILSSTFKLWFLDRMVAMYDAYNTAQ